ncbi:MAG: hypothetical protein N2645_12225 [Clostridia bacterium]|nr:hypothetical protein [Clostridia bacterium]
MEDWKEIIKDRIEKQRLRDSEIQSAISALITELKNPPTSLKADFEKIDRIKLVWRILIEQKTFEISNQEILEVQAELTNPALSEQDCIREALIKLFLQKYYF